MNKNLERDFILKLIEIGYDDIVFRTSYSNKGKQKFIYILGIEIPISKEEFIMLDKLVNRVEAIKRKRRYGEDNG